MFVEYFFYGEDCDILRKIIFFSCMFFDLYLKCIISGCWYCYFINFFYIDKGLSNFKISENFYGCEYVKCV